MAQEPVTAGASLRPSYTSTGSMSLDASIRTGSRLRGALSDLVIDLFRANEQSVKQAGLTWVAARSELVSDQDLDKWLRRPSGVLVVGSNKPLLARLINGEDVKNQATGTIRTATGNLIYLNLSQLMKMRLRSIHVDWQKSAIPELRDYGNCLEEALCEKFCSALLERSSTMYTKDAGGVERESFTNVERKFLGRRLFIHLGVLTHPENTSHAFQFELEGSLWFIFCGVKVPKSPEECRGVYFRYPSLDVTLARPPGSESVLCFAENKDSHRGSSSAQATWHILEAKTSTGIDELVRASLSFKTSSTTTTAPRGTARTRASVAATADALPPKAPLPRKAQAAEAESLKVTETSKASMASEPETDTGATCESRDPPAEEEEMPPSVEMGEGDFGEEETEAYDGTEEEGAGANEWWAQGPVEYDEAVPTYYDYQQETYFYYGNVLYFDPDWSSYYYYDWEQESYMYVDEETQQAINEGTIPIWNSEDQQYYDPSQGVEEEEAGEEHLVEAEGQEEDAPAAQKEESPEMALEPDQTTKSADQAEPEAIRSAIEVEELVHETPTDKPAEEVVTAATTPRELEVAAPDITTTTTSADPIESQAGESVPTELTLDDTGSSVDDESKPYAQASLTRTAKAAVSQPPKAPDRFSGSIDQFQSSETMLVNRAMRQLIELLEPQSHLLTEYAKRPNGTLRIGRNRRLIDGLIHGTMELKSLTATDCSDVASSLAVLNLPQLIHIRQQAQNSAWDKSPQSALKTFAMKTDSLIAEKLVVFCLQRTSGANEAEASSRNEHLMKLLSALECRHVGSQLIFVVGAMAELKQSRERIMGEAYCAGVSPTTRASWWFLASSPTGGVVVPRGTVVEKPKGLFLKLPAYEAQFDRPDGIDHVFKLVAGRQSGGFIQWDVLEITL